MDMQRSKPLSGNDFSGHFNSQGPQLLGNNFHTNGAPINFNTVESGTDNSLPTTVHELPNFLLSPYFTGRSDELQEIERVFSTSSDKLPRSCVLHGMPGVGKTQLAVKFATLASEEGRYPYIFWLTGASVEKMSQDVSKIVDLLHLPGRHTLNQASRLTAARAWLEEAATARSWLLVLDNVKEETAVTLHDILPRQNCCGRILMTTRIATVLQRFTTSGESSQLALQPPGLSDATAMLAAGANLKREDQTATDDKDVERLVHSVGSLPLAIDQAASYLRETGSSPQEALDIYGSEEVSEILSWENDLSRYKEKSVIATFTPALDRIQQTSPDAVTLLRLLCFCDPEAIPISIFEQGCNALKPEDQQKSSPPLAIDKLKGTRGFRQSWKRLSDAIGQKSKRNPVQVQSGQMLEAVRGFFRSRIRLSQAIQEVQRLSLIVHTLVEGDRIIRIHDLVHLILRSKLMTDTERGQWLEITVDIVCKAFECIDDRRSPENWGQCGRFISHIESLEKFAEQYGFRSDKLLDTIAWAAVYLYTCGLYEKAVSLDKRTLEQREHYLGKKHPSTLTSMNNLASTLDKQGEYEEAERIHRQALALHESVLGKKHPNTLTSMNNLALTLNSQGQYKEAERIHRQALALRVLVLGEKHPITLTSMNNLASTLDIQGEYEEAERIYRQVLALSELVLGEKHPDILASTDNLASTLDNQGEYEEAERIHRQVLALYESVLGKKHPSTLTSLNNLAVAFEKQGKYIEAERTHRQVLAFSESVLGKKHPDTLTTMSNLALVFYRQGEYEEAEKIHRQALALCESVLGKKHPDTLTSMENLAFAWRSQGRNREAISLIKDCLNLRDEILGPEHPHTKDSLEALHMWESEEDIEQSS